MELDIRDRNFALLVNKDKAGFMLNEPPKFTYPNYLWLDSSTTCISLKEGEKASPLVNHIVVIRNVYKNEVLATRGKFYMLLENNTWIDPAPFDDFSVLSAQRCFSRTFGSLSAKYVDEHIHKGSSLRVSGACSYLGNFYVLTQIIVNDGIDNLPTSTKWVPIQSLTYSTPLEQAIIDSLAIVKNREEK